jgi:peptide/nickel transport system substrate-binding protein
MDNNSNGGRIMEELFENRYTRRGVLAGAAAGAALLTAPGVAGAMRGLSQATDTLVVGLEGETATINQNLENSPQAYPMYSALHERLIYANPFRGGRLEPQLATSWTLGPDRRTWTFKLRRGVRFHNGEPFDARSVKTSFDTMMALRPPSPTAARVSLVDRVVIVDRNTVKFITKVPWPLAPQNISEIVMLPAKALETVGNKGLAQNPIGTGPFRFVEWDKGDHVTLEAFPGYWGPKPNLKKLVFRFYPETSSRIAALQSGQVQLAHKVPPDTAKRLRSGGMKIGSAPAGTGIVLVMMQLPTPSPFANLALRQALNHATDKATLLKALLQGYGRVLNGQPVGQDCYGFNPALRPTPYNPERAKRLLDTAGYDGGKITFWATDAFFIKQLDVAQAINQQYHEIGIKTELRTLDGSTFLRRQLQSQDLYPLYSGGWQYLPVMDGDFPLQWYKSDSPLKTGLMSKQFDRAYAAQVKEFNPQRRLIQLRRCMKILNDQAASVWLWQEHDIWAASKNVSGFRASANLRPVWTTVTA